MVKCNPKIDSINTRMLQDKPPVKEPPERPGKPPVKEPGEPADHPPPPADPPVEEPPSEPYRPPVKEPPPEDPDRDSPRSTRISSPNTVIVPGKYRIQPIDDIGKLI